MDDVRGKVALVTGASAGIGLAVARKLAAAGAQVAMVARTQATLDEAARTIGEKAVAFPCDVTDLARMAALPGEVVARLGGLDILVNNAGTNHRGAVAERTGQELVDIITTNLTAPIFLTRACLPHLRRGGAIINVASLAGMIPVDHEAAYSASKAGLRAFTRALRAELEGDGITVSSVCPGPVDTGFFGDVSQVPDLVFSQPMSSAEQIAEAVVECVLSGAAETAIPAMSGRLCTLAYVFPGMHKALKPMFIRRGARNKKRFMESKKPDSP